MRFVLSSYVMLYLPHSTLPHPSPPFPAPFSCLTPLSFALPPSHLPHPVLCPPHTHLPLPFQIFAFGGQFAFTEIMGTMHTPSHFPRAVSVCTVIMSALYGGLGAVGYWSRGDQVGVVVVGKGGKRFTCVLWGSRAVCLSSAGMPCAMGAVRTV